MRLNLIYREQICALIPSLMKKLFSQSIGVFLLIFGLGCSAAFSDVVQINTTADGYKYLGAPAPANSSNYYMDVGLYGTPGDHYSVGFAKFNTDLSSLSGASNIFLAINLRNFVEPIFGNGITNQPTDTQYPTSGGNFTLKATALTSTFPSSGVNATWVFNNVVSPSAAGTVVFQNAGLHYMNITSTVQNWISSSATIKELAFVGIASTPNTWSLNIGTLENHLDLDGNLISAASPMYLTTIPEPSTPALLSLGLCVICRLRRRAKS